MENPHGGYELHDFIAEYYDTSYNRRNSTDVEFFVDYARKCGGRTLELGCGTGRVLIPTAVARCDITGLDLSVYMLQKCREKLAAQPQEVQKRVKLIQGDMTDFKTGEKYALITLPFRPFQHLITVEEQKACLGCIHEHLEPRGRLIIDIFNPNPLRLMPNPKNMEDLRNAAIALASILLGLGLLYLAYKILKWHIKKSDENFCKRLYTISNELLSLGNSTNSSLITTGLNLVCIFKKHFGKVPCNLYLGKKAASGVPVK